MKMAYAELELRVEERTAQLSVANAALTAEIAEHKRTSEEREKLQEHLNQSQKMDSVGRLAGGVAHDFNNMLGVILGHTEIALMEIAPDEPMFERMQAIRKAAEHSADLTRQLLTFARKQSVTPKILDLNQTVEESLNMLRRLIGENIELAWLPATEMWKIKIDPSQIIQILVNLCVNARDALAGEGRRITIKTGRSTADEISSLQDNEITLGEYVWIAVSDDGCGIEKETLSRLFEPFFTTKGIGKGTGLGLSTVYGIVKQNSGFIKVHSESGKGTTFRIYFPRDKGDAESELSYDEALFHIDSIVQNNYVSEISDPLSQKSLLSKETILLVEDEPGILEIATKMLERLGYRVLSASTPKQAIELADKYSEDINLVITDVIMPEMNGRDMVEKIRTLYPQLKCLFMSGYTASIISQHGVLNRGVQFIQKPFSIKDIAVSVREALDQQI
ncbi:MAG: response regulator [Desulfamplus sp.]|nr:response regulator [Desulfamplus sp.]